MQRASPSPPSLADVLLVASPRIRSERHAQYGVWRGLELAAHVTWSSAGELDVLVAPAAVLARMLYHCPIDDSRLRAVAAFLALEFAPDGQIKAVVNIAPWRWHTALVDARPHVRLVS